MEEITEQKGSAGEHTPRSGGIKAHKAAAERHEAEDRDRAEMRRRRAARERRRKKRKIQRAILIAAMVLILLLAVLLVRTVVKKVTGSSKKEPAKTTSVEVKKEDKAKSKEATATINIAGDIIMHKPFLTSSVYKNGDDYDYNPIFQYVKDYYNDADIFYLYDRVCSDWR
ncbi:hypothetical protein [Dorea sp. AF36-15AT]|uniref:hypothetical protein n=1 Tax=Dorea sp. AF36-15AT TaxID=2292041 RepID=UPI000E54A081|nr:hypothetical protein [Dorea sp. AF36-15AT]RHP06694.1 hypothetical protein DWZ93_12775 [Dorea sp. AF36-15AT]